MNVALVINPVSGGGKGKKVGQRFVRELGQSGVHFTIIQEESEQQTIATLNRIHEKDAFSSIVSVGGDGQAHLLFPFAIDWKVPILVVPAGTGNDFARSAGTFGKNASQLVEALTRTIPTRIDMGKVVRGEEITWFGQVLSTGFDSLVNERANRYKFFKGKIKYVIATARELPFFVPRTYAIELDEIAFESGAMLVAIANGKSYGGGMLVCPEAKFTDGLFDVLILKPIPVKEFVRVFPRVFSGKHINHPAVEIRRCSKVTLSSKAIAYADGERIGELPIEVRLVPQVMQTWLL